MGTKALANLAAGRRLADIPREVVAEGQRALVNYFAVALAGSRDPDIGRLITVLSRFRGDADAGVIGTRHRLDMLGAAFVNAASANVFDFDDTHIPTILHPTATVAAPLFAYAEVHPVSGADLLAALVIGIEVECRIANAMSPYHYSHGWHITTTCGVFGAAAAVGRLIGLDERGMTRALASAAATSAGVVQTLGTAAKSVGVGNAARNGMLAAMFAAEGCNGPENVFEGPYGYLSVFGDGDRSRELAARQDSWQILSNTYKPYPCGVVLNPVIDACLLLRDRVAVERIETVTVLAEPLLRERTDRPEVRSGRLSQVSAQHAAAVTLLRGMPGLEDFSDAAVSDPAITSLARKIRVRDDPSIPSGGARVEIVLSDGGSHDVTVERATGSLEAPLDNEALADKLRELGSPSLSVENMERLLEAIWSLDKADTASLPIKLAATG